MLQTCYLILIYEIDKLNKRWGDRCCNMELKSMMEVQILGMTCVVQIQNLSEINRQGSKTKINIKTQDSKVHHNPKGDAQSWHYKL